MKLLKVRTLPTEEEQRNESGTTQRVSNDTISEPLPRRRTSRAKREQNFRFILAAALAGRVYHGFPLTDPSMNVTQLLQDTGLDSVMELFEHLTAATDETQKDYWIGQILDWLNKEAVAQG